MLSSFLYILIGVFDVLAVFVLIMKLYRLPIIYDLKYIIGFCVISSTISYVIRIQLQSTWLDMPVLIIMLLVFYRVFLKVKFIYAALIVSAGINAYVLIQLAVIMLFTSLINFDDTVVAQSQTLQIQIIQVTSILCAYLIGWLLYHFEWGFSFIPMPPHEFSIKTVYRKNKTMILTATIGLVFLSLALTLLINSHQLLLIPASVVIFGVSYYFSYKRDISYD